MAGIARRVLALLVLVPVWTSLDAAHAYRDISAPVRLTQESSERESEPALAYSPGVVVALWSRNNSTSGVVSAYSLDEGQHWTARVLFSPPPGFSRVRQQPAICSDGEGKFYAAALVDGTTTPPSGRAIAVWPGTFSNGILVWGQAQLAFPGCSATSFTGPCFDMPSISCIPGTDTVFVAATLLSGSSYASLRSTIQFARSVDGAQTWSQPLTLSSDRCNGCSLAYDPSGALYAVWKDFFSSTIQFAKSVDQGISFTAATVVSSIVDNLASGPPGLRPQGGRQNSTYAACGSFMQASDFPKLAIATSSGSDGGVLHVVWAEGPTGTILPGINSYGESEPNGSFAAADEILIGDTVVGSTLGEIGGPDRDIFKFEGLVGETIWLQTEMTLTFNPPQSGTQARCSFLRLICGRDTLSQPVLARTGFQEAFRGAMPGIIYTLPFSGLYYIELAQTEYTADYALRLKRFAISPSSRARDNRDIVRTSSSDGGMTWGEPALLMPEMPGDDALPSLLVTPSGELNVAWYSSRDGGNCGGAMNSYLWCLPLGVEAGEEARVSTVSSVWLHVNGSGSIGNVGDEIALASLGAQSMIGWVQLGLPDVDIYAATASEPVVGSLFLGFMAVREDNGVRFEWAVPPDHGVVGFEISIEGEDAGFLVGADASPGQTHYVVRAPTPGLPSGTIFMLRAVLRDGTELEGPSVVLSEAPPVSNPSLAAYPNPFRGSTVITLGTGLLSPRVIRVLDLQGRTVRELVTGSEGGSSVVWDGKDDEGSEVPAGMYFVHASNDRSKARLKILKFH